MPCNTIQSNTMRYIEMNVLLSQPKLQKAVHQAPSTTSQALRPPSGAFERLGWLGAFSASFSEEVEGSSLDPAWLSDFLSMLSPEMALESRTWSGSAALCCMVVVMLSC